MFDTEWDTVEERNVLPEGLAEMAPGGRLAALLESIDRSRLNGHELVILLQARSRQIAHLQAELYADMWELAFTPPGDAASPAERLDTIDEFASDEIAAAMTLTPRSADRQLSLVSQLAELPRVWKALREGSIDLARAKVFCQETGHLDSDEARDVADSLVDAAAGLTSRQLGGRLRRRCMENDPEAARRRYDDGVSERRVESHSNPDGTADLCVRQLPPHRVAAIVARLHRLARRTKRDGDERTLDQIRADLAGDFLDGHCNHTAGPKGTVELRVALTTLMGLDEQAGEIPGWGPIISDLARQVATQQHHSRWTFVVDDRGEPIHTGTTRRRPTTPQRRHVQARNPRCSFPGCPAPATRCHMDHTIAYGRHGPTIVVNLGPLCARHHLRAKHRAGWQLEQPRPGHFHWTSPRGHHYHIRPPPP